MTNVFREFPQSFWENSGILPQLCHDRILLNPFQIFIYQSYLPTLNGLETESADKYPTKADTFFCYHCDHEPSEF
jgi:hypothetical protein